MDANAFIWGARDPYPMPGAVAYWNWFENMVTVGKITTHKRVIEEVLAGAKVADAEPIITWVRTRKRKLIDPAADSGECTELVGKLCEYSFKEFGEARTIEFSKGADLFLIARAKLDNGTVVTQESNTKRVRIPTLCRKFSVPYKTLFQMNKDLNMEL